ncbi:MAG: transcriptional repressor LexA [Alphaproteobacteria bacterium]|nr:transcriptional repressor LexA [Alphaproteobacteria bacterium]
MLTPKQYKLLMYIDNTIKETGCCPSYEEMKTAVNIKSKSGIYTLIEELIDREFIRKMPHRARALEVLRIPKFKPREILEEEKKIKTALKTASAQIPLYGKIAAGTPIEAIAYENETINVPFDLVERGQFYALRIEGESMIEAGIMDGDIAVIKRCEVAENGQIVVALVDENEATLKVWQRQKDEIWLKPCNKNYEIRKLHPSQVRVQGVLRGIIRQYN